MRLSEDEAWTRQKHRELLHRYRLLRKIRPGALAVFTQRVTAPDERRRIVRADSGLRLYLDPFTHLGLKTLSSGRYEPETEQLFRCHIKQGDVVLDVGANEGYFSALAGTIVGDRGLVIAVEPQSRLRDIIEINLRINAVQRFAIYRNALGGDDGATGTINLWPSFNTGASSLAHKYRFSRTTEELSFVSLDRILADQRIDAIDFAKVDVEGFEAEVVASLGDHLKRHSLRKLLLDYHRPTLEARSIDPRTIHDQIMSAGYQALEGDSVGLNTYVLYAA